jgi:hypothetical protein
MARQKGIHKLKGTLGDVTYLQTKDGALAREKSSIAKSRILSDDAFKRTRENGSEFGRAGKAVKVFRDAFRVLVKQSADGRMTSRMVRDMVKVIKADATNARGERNVIDGEATLLEGFEFNVNAKLGSTLYAPYTATIDRASGQLLVTVPPFLPVNMISGPSGSTHFSIVSGAAEIDFEKGSFVNSLQSSAELPWNANATAALNLQHALTANSTHPLFLALGIVFYQEVNNVRYALKNGAFNVVSLIKVDA